MAKEPHQGDGKAYDTVPNDPDAALADPGVRDPVLAQITTSVEPHVLASALALVIATICDAMTLLEPPIGTPAVPCCMRTSSIICALVLASPRIAFVDTADGTTKGFTLLRQRILLVVPLATCAFWGLHYGSEATRIGDVMYTGIVLLMAVQIYTTGGIENESVRPDNITTSPHRRQTVAGLCAALMIYVGLRGVRSAFVAADEVADRKVQYETSTGEDVVVVGHGQIDLQSVLPLAVGHGTLVCVGLLVATNSKTHYTGSATTAFEVGMAGATITLAALWTTLAKSAVLDGDPALYGRHSCARSRDLCQAAYRSRRFNSINHSEASLWISGLAALLFAVAIERRAARHGVTRAERLFEQQGLGFGSALLFGALVAFWTYGSTEGSSWYVDACAVAAVLGTFVSTFGDAGLGGAVSASAFAVLLYRLEDDYGTAHVYQQGDGTLLQASTALMAVHALFELVVGLVTLCGCVWNPGSIVISASASTAVLGTSLSFLLFLGSGVVLAGTNGAAPFVYDTSGKRTAIAFVVLHFLPLLAWMPLYTCRCYVSWASRRLRVMAWHSAALLALGVQMAFTIAAPLSAPDLAGVEETPVVLAGVTTLVCWFVSGYV